MKLKELIEDLNSKCPERYFTKRLFGGDTRTYQRRTFDDLYKLYKEDGVTETLLLQALYEGGFSGAVCNDIKKVVFFRYYKQRFNTFWGENSIGGRSYHLHAENTIYTAAYLDNIFKDMYVNNKL